MPGTGNSRCIPSGEGAFTRRSGRGLGQAQTPAAGGGEGASASSSRR